MGARKKVQVICFAGGWPRSIIIISYGPFSTDKCDSCMPVSLQNMGVVPERNKALDHYKFEIRVLEYQ